MIITPCTPETENIFESPSGDCYQALQDAINADNRFQDVLNQPNQVTYNGSVFSFCYYYSPNGAQNNGVWIHKIGTANWIFALCSNTGRKKARISSLVDLQLAQYPQVFTPNYQAPPNFNGNGLYIEDINLKNITIAEWVDEIAARMDLI